MEGDRVNRATSPRARNMAVPGPLGSSSSSSAEDGDDTLIGVSSNSLSSYNSFKMNINDDDFDSPAGHSSISGNSNSNLNNISSNGGISISNSSGSGNNSNVSGGGDIESGSGLGIGLGLKQAGTASEGANSEFAEYSRPLIIFGSIDISKLPIFWQFTILCSGLIIFMCLYGYYQELVQYGFFERKLPTFSTFLHFLGCFIFAHLQRQYQYKKRTNDKVGADKAINIDDSEKKESRFMTNNLFVLGTAPRYLAVFFYAILIGLKTATQALTNMSMAQINYPAKVLFKSANPIITIIVGLVWFRKQYPFRDYVVVFMLAIGLYIFVCGDNSVSSSPSGTTSGIILVSIAMICGATVPIIQEFCIQKYNATVEELLYHIFFGSTLLTFVISICNSEMGEGIRFLRANASFSTYFALSMFSTVGFCGSNFSVGLTLRFGALVNGIANTARKAITLVLSFILFPERNHICFMHFIGATIFFSGLVVRIVYNNSNSLIGNNIVSPKRSISNAS